MNKQLRVVEIFTSLHNSFLYNDQKNCLKELKKAQAEILKLLKVKQ